MSVIYKNTRSIAVLDWELVSIKKFIEKQHSVPYPRLKGIIIVEKIKLIILHSDGYMYNTSTYIGAISKQHGFRCMKYARLQCYFSFVSNIHTIPKLNNCWFSSFSVL